VDESWETGALGSILELTLEDVLELGVQAFPHIKLVFARRNCIVNCPTDGAYLHLSGAGHTVEKSSLHITFEIKL